MSPKARHTDPHTAARPPPPAEEPEVSEEEDEEEFDLAAAMNEMTADERRKVYALHGLLKDYQEARAKHRAELSKLQAENHKALAAIFLQRREIVTGARDITAEEVASVPVGSSPSSAEKPEDGEKEKGVRVVAPSDEAAQAALTKAASDPNGGIPNFWLTAMTNSEVLDGMITERDRLALAHLLDIRCDHINGDPAKGVIITFTFGKNEFFSNETLTKRYEMEFNEDDGDYEIAEIVGCDIDWTDAKRTLTVVVKEKKQRNKKNNQIRVVQREEKCESFFNFFSPPKPPATDDDDDDEADEDGEFYDQEMEMDVEAGQALMEEIVPKAAHYYTGKSVEDVAKMLAERFGFGADGEDDEEDEEDEEDEDEEDGDGHGDAFRAMVNQRGGGGAGRGRGGRGAAGTGAGAGAPQQQQQQECKQQ